jgi:hypothetical protein
VAVVFLVGIFAPSTWMADFRPSLARLDPVNSSSTLLRWNSAIIKLFYLGIACWAVFSYRQTGEAFKRIIYSSIVAVTVLVFGSDLLAVSRPNLAGLIHHPIGTALGYISAALIIVAILIEVAEERASK